MTAEQVVEAEVVEENGTEPTTELTIAPTQPSTLFRTDDPVQVLARATEVANALADVIRKRKLYVKIQGRDHVLVEGWLTLGSMLGVTAICEWTRPVENGWEARVLAKTLDGRTIGAAEAQCLSTEGKPWNKAEGYAIRSMAQTRATSKALASVLRFVVTLVGYSGTPAEEAEAAPAAARPSASPTKRDDLPPERVAAIVAGIKAVGWSFKQLSVQFGAVGAEAQAVNRPDSVAKAIRQMTPDQADAFEHRLHEAADQ